ncbi:MAG: copper chaperone PCu(A)C [Nitrospiraceae bacterium]|nr:MAG: copper chaperone PCu(A)C [Nitrospiraceae bacterium]
MGKIRFYFITLLVPALLFLYLNGTATGMGTSPAVPLIRIEAQEAILSSVIIGSGSVFLKIVNEGEGDDNLTGAEVNIGGTLTELHNVKNGKMVRAEKIHVPAKTTVELKPGGLHIMMFRIPEDMKEGNEFILYLKFERSGKKEVKVRLGKGIDDHLMHHH